MATTVGSFSAIDDTEVDAESPITETLMTRMRDNSYWIDAGTRQTTQTSTTKVLTPDGSGGVSWVEIDTIGGVDGTKGTLSITTSDLTVTSATDGILKIDVQQRRVDSGSSTLANVTTSIVIDLSDDTYASTSGGCDQNSYAIASGVFSGTLSGTYAQIGYSSDDNGAMAGQLQMRRSGGNVQIKINTISNAAANEQPFGVYVIL